MKTACADLFGYGLRPLEIDTRGKDGSSLMCEGLFTCAANTGPTASDHSNLTGEIPYHCKSPNQLVAFQDLARAPLSTACSTLTTVIPHQSFRLHGASIQIRRSLQGAGHHSLPQASAFAPPYCANP